MKDNRWDEGEKEDEIKKITAALKKIQIQQAVLIERLENITRKSENNTQEGQHEFKIGDRVEILNPGPLQQRVGIVKKIGKSRITVETENGKDVVRAPKNVRMTHLK